MAKPDLLNSTLHQEGGALNATATVATPVLVSVLQSICAILLQTAIGH
jgi:hypothetical protein